MCGWAGRYGTVTLMSDAARVPIGHRVIVTGMGGSGKSTFALALAARTGLPVIHLDLHFWKPGWVEPSDDEWRTTQQRVLAGDAWIADGNYSSTLALRLGVADTLVVLDLPWSLCAGRALLRGFRMPSELPVGSTYTRWQRLRDESKLAVLIWRNRHSEPESERRIVAEHGQHLAVHVLKSRRSVREFLDRAALSK